MGLANPEVFSSHLFYCQNKILDGFLVTRIFFRNHVILAPTSHPCCWANCGYLKNTSRFPLCFLIPTENLVKTASNDDTTAWTAWKKICAKLISTSPLNSSSYKVLGHGQNVNKFCTRMQREWSLVQFLMDSSCPYKTIYASTACCLLPGIWLSELLQNHPYSGYSWTTITFFCSAPSSFSNSSTNFPDINFLS